MKKNFFFISVWLLVVLSSCTNDNTFIKEPNNIKSGYIILQKRHSKLPYKTRTSPIIFTDTLNITTRTYNENGTIIGNSDALLGYSYAVGNTILGDYNNVGRKIIDLEKIRKYSTDYITPKQLKQFSSERF